MVNRSKPHQPSLTRPIFTPQSAEKSKHISLSPKYPVPGYPEIDAQWTGAYIEPIRSIGENTAFPERPSPHLKIQLEIANFHEVSHAILTSTLIPLLIRLNTFKMYQEIARLCKGERSLKIPELNTYYIQTDKLTGQIIVPLKPTSEKQASVLQRLWKRIADLKVLEDSIQESFAIWNSLYHAQKSNLISEQERNEMGKEYLSEYNNYLDTVNLINIYNVLEYVGVQFGFSMAYFFAETALNTLTPEKTIKRLIQLTLKYQGTENLHMEEAEADLNEILNIGDDFKHYCSRSELDLLWPLSQTQEKNVPTGQIEIEWLRRKRDFQNHFFYTNNNTTWHLNTENEEIELKNLMSYLCWYESLRQQLTTGIGVWCPCWSGGSDCCANYINPDCRKLMEEFLRNTTHEMGDRGDWRGKGCLENIKV